MQLLKKIYDKLSGGYFAIAGGIIGLTSILIAVILHSITVPVSIFKQFVSNMGIGPNGASVVFMIGLLITATMLLLFFPYAVNTLWIEGDSKGSKKKNLILIGGAIFSIIAIIGLYVLSIFNMSIDTIVIHAIGAIMLFMGAVIVVLLFTIALHIEKRSSKIQLVLGITAIFFFSAMIIAVAVV